MHDHLHQIQHYLSPMVTGDGPEQLVNPIKRQLKTLSGTRNMDRLFFNNIALNVGCGLTAKPYTKYHQCHATRPDV